MANQHLVFLILAGAAACTGKAPTSASAEAVTITRADVDRLQPGNRLTLEADPGMSYHFDQRLGAIDFTRIDFVDEAMDPRPFTSIVDRRVPLDLSEIDLQVGEPSGAAHEAGLGAESTAWCLHPFCFAYHDADGRYIWLCSQIAQPCFVVTGSVE